jgi:hypothetical protein
MLRQDPKSAQPDPVGIGQRLDFVDNRIDDPLQVAVGEVRMSPGDEFDQSRLDHRVGTSWLGMARTQALADGCLARAHAYGSAPAQ